MVDINTYEYNVQWRIYWNGAQSFSPQVQVRLGIY